ncbi:diguanylate cyclase [Shewanella sp. WXL01]|uniref:Diguanylate cyclase n=1 Tax=Shewanella maritima TaxID=2520507 RepID=A0A411PKV4_9GAMM|nr:MULTISPECIES: diguanylate cyclase [Shewanella]NKF51796.1 diguanylate cyclase [Shewanella sp. WXL01]QBF84145.1 diguanylate cyclase [Shewanella maritima]
MIYSFRNSSFRDPETGVYNQNYFMEVFNREWHRHLREKQSLALLYLCPHIHETVKQPHLLELFTNQVEEALLRATDLIARLDTNHFALGLFNVDDEGTKVVLQRIDEQINQFLANHAKDHKFTIDYKVAAGVCQPNKNLNIEKLFVDVEQLSSALDNTHDDQHHKMIRVQ